jgi:hypothetical protein
MRQFDFLFSSDSQVAPLRISALKEPERWGPSDRCCIEINIFIQKKPADFVMTMLRRPDVTSVGLCALRRRVEWQ